MSKKYQRHRSRPAGFTILELLIVIGVIGVLLAMFLPAMRTTHDAARRTACANNLRQIVIAMHNFHDNHQYLPKAMGTLELGEPSSHDGADRLSGLVAILPLIEQVKLWEQVSEPTTIDGVRYPAGPAPWESGYTPWQQEIPVFRCPSAVESQNDFGSTSYAFCIGDLARQIHQPNQARGTFAPGLKTRLEDISDGTSCTIAMTEVGTAAERRLGGQYVINQSGSALKNPSQFSDSVIDLARSRFYADSVLLGSMGRGGCWADGAAGCGLVNTVLPPGGPSCSLSDSQYGDGIFSAGSFHGAGVNVAYADASVHVISRSVDAGDLSQPTPTLEQLSERSFASPYGVWGALGSAAGEDETNSL